METFFINLTGYLGGGLSALMFLPQLYRIYKLQGANEISYGMLILGNFASIMILTHSALLKSKSLVVTCSISVFIRFSTLCYKYYIDHIQTDLKS